MDYSHFFGRINYDYAGRYLFEANLRYDGSSRFLRENRWNFFPSFSAGWNIAREKFWEPLTDYVNTLKPELLGVSWVTRILITGILSIQPSASLLRVATG